MGSGGELNSAERAALLALARGSLESAARRESFRLPSDLPERLREPAGAFVTCRDRRGALLGCIGIVEAAQPLAEAVAEMAEAASQHDPRFPPIHASQLADVRLQISVLSAPFAIGAEEVEPGRHGLIVESQGHRGLLLPQVAEELGWDRATFLEQTCLKARLPRDAWREPGTRILAFTAQVFGEEEA